jgi:hypothetical protein
MAQPPFAPRDDVPTRALLPFVGLTFVISWGIVGTYILAPDWAAARFGALGGAHPLFFLATWAPALSAILLVLLHTGRGGLRRFLSRLLLWRSAAVWWLLILIGIPLVYVAGSLMKGGGVLAPLPPGGIGAGIAFLFMMAFLGPIEEFGWRGLAQPILQRHMAPLWAGMLIGATWGVWHLPAFYLAGVVYEDWSFLPFFLGNVTLAVLVTPIFNSARGSLLLPMLFHWQLINPFWPDAQPHDTWILMGLTLLIVLIWRGRMFTRQGAVNRVVPTG